MEKIGKKGAREKRPIVKFYYIPSNYIHSLPLITSLYVQFHAKMVISSSRLEISHSKFAQGGKNECFSGEL